MFDDVQLQFLLGGTNIATTGRSEGKMHTGDSCGTRRPRLDDQRMATLSRKSMLKGHKENLTFLRALPVAACRILGDGSRSWF